MSGESVLAFFRKSKTDPFLERFAVENDRRLFGCMGSGSTFGAALVVYALSIQIFPNPGREDGFSVPQPEPPVWPKHGDDIIRVKPPVNYHGSIRDRRMAHTDAHVPPGPGRADHQPPKPKAVKPAVKDPGVLKVAVIPYLKKLASGNAYNLLGNSARHTDLNKLEEFGSLTRTDPTRLGGRLGRQSNDFNQGYSEDGTADKTDGGITLPNLPTTSGIVGAVKVPKGIGGSVISVDQFQNTTTRSTASILAVIRAHSSGLRHVYNTHLKLRPGLAGKVTLRFAIAPSGAVVDVGLAGSTTDNAAFDAEILRQVIAWRFEPVKAPGNDLVTVPFNFSE
ncbi:MAG: AgmX/PglI C-terminal domain-containing protein [Fibrobacteria bacterium]